MTTPNTPTPHLDRDALERARTATAEALGDALDCIRVWGVGTMSEDDFLLVADDPGRVAEIADAAVVAYIAALPHASGAEPVAVWREALEIIAGKRQCLDNLMSHVEVARAALKAALPPASGAEPVAEKLGRFGHHPDPVIDFEVEVQALEDEFSNLKASFTNGTPTMAELEARGFRAMDFRVGGDVGAIKAKAALRTLEARMKAASAPPSAPSGDGDLSHQEQIDALKQTGVSTDIKFTALNVIDELHKAGFRIVRTASSGEPG